MRKIILTATLALALLFMATLLTSGNLFARTMICKNDPDYFSKRCTLHPYAVTKVVNGNVVRGHLVGCQFKSYTCMVGVCEENNGPMQIPYYVSMDHHSGFCDLLCNNPTCKDPLGWQ
ncbi:hypothetical protein C6366_10385 [Desulfonatronum sp. SC1]|nr:hypothetical protein C6366_10385 [Desulfonatronum sp. SC1]